MRPNILLILVDEERYPPIYENQEIKAWRRQNLIAQERLREHGIEFHRHYIGSTACSPSRATIMTGQYPSLHGVSQTTGVAKEVFDSDMFWLDRNTVPTMGDYFRAAGYQTHYRGKWHVSYEDIVVPGTHTSITSYHPLTGVPDEEKTLLYAHTDRLDSFGFSGWIGPEPHGKNPRNSGSSAAIGLSGRDEVYAEKVVQLIESLEREKMTYADTKPWLVVYRKLYYQLQKNADQQMQKVLDALSHSIFDENTIIIFTSDHGDLLGAHGNLHQKWYCAYEEALHVPFIIHNKGLFAQHRSVHHLTSHVDLLPTMLGFTNVGLEEIQQRMSGQFSDLRPFVGRDLGPLIAGEASSAEDTIYFMTDDDVTRGQHQTNIWGEAYASVIQPNHIESVITSLHKDGTKQLWKLSRYFDNAQFWSKPSVKDVTTVNCATTTKTQPVPDEYELYNLTEDPLERYNLAHSAFATSYSRSVQQWMQLLLEEQRKLKRLYPHK